MQVMNGNPYQFQSKTFPNEDKTDKSSVWFSNQVTTFNHALLWGSVALGWQLKVQYIYLTSSNKDYTARDSNGNPIKPYHDARERVLVLSFLYSNEYSFLYHKGDEKSSTASNTKTARDAGLS